MAQMVPIVLLMLQRDRSKELQLEEKILFF